VVAIDLIQIGKEPRRPKYSFSQLQRLTFFGEVFQVFALYIVGGVFGRTVPK